MYNGYSKKEIKQMAKAARAWALTKEGAATVRETIISIQVAIKKLHSKRKGLARESGYFRNVL